MGLFSKKNSDEKEQPKTKKYSGKQIANQMKTIQRDIMTFDAITQDGVLCAKKEYSKMYSLPDANFEIEPEERQIEILKKYVALVNLIPDNAALSLVIVNKRSTTDEIAASYHFARKKNELDKYIEDYNAIIDEKIKEGNNDIKREKYLLITITARSYKDALTTFNSLDISLNEKVKAINKSGVKPVDALNRLRIMREIANGTSEMPFDKEFERYIDKTSDEEGKVTKQLSAHKMKRAGISIKDIVSPSCYVKEFGNVRLGEERVAKSYVYADLPSSLDTSFLTKTTSLPYEMVTVVQFKSVPRKKALRQVKMMNTSIKADVIKESQKAYRNGYDPSLMSEDLVLAQEESGKLREDILVHGKKLFFATIVTTLLANNTDELQKISKIYASNCGDFSVTPNPLVGQQTRGLKTALLIGASEVIIDRMVTSDDIRAIFPFCIQELSDKRGHYYGNNAVSKNMNMYDRKRSPLANGMIFGRSGSGKSFITKAEIVANLLDGDDQMIILDPENEYAEICRAFKGVQIDLETSADYHINPCDMSMEWDDKRANPLGEKCDYMVGIVESILGNGRSCNSYEVAVIHRAVTKMYEPYMEEMKRRYLAGDKRNIDYDLCPTLVDFFNTLIKDDSLEARKLSQAIEPYCIGTYNIFSHHTNVNTENRLIVYNTLYLPDKMKEMAMKVCLANIWTRIVDNKERNKLLGVNKSIWVYLDEFHLFFTTESCATTIKAYFKRVRKYGGIMTGKLLAA